MSQSIKEKIDGIANHAVARLKFYQNILGIALQITKANPNRIAPLEEIETLERIVGKAGILLDASNRLFDCVNYNGQNYYPVNN